jgi:phage-related protein (TIGR01555 family)
MQEAITWGRLYGGCLLVIGAEQGLPSTPLNVAKVRDVKFLNVVDRRFASVNTYYSDPFAPNYGEIETYRVNGLNGTSTIVHETRVIRFDGVRVDAMKRRELGGWSLSVLQRPYDVMRTFATAFQAAGVLTADASQAVFKLKGLFEMIASGEKDRLQTRMQMVDMQRSSARAVLLDADGEDFQRIKTDFTGYPEMLDRLMMRLASSIDMPVTILMGRSPAGQNATGDSDFQHWYDSISAFQANDLTEKLLRVFTILSKGELSEDAEIEWCNLSEPTEEQRATTTKTLAEADALYIDKGVVIPEQIAIARFGSGQGRIAVDEVALLRGIKSEHAFSGELEKARGSLGQKELAALSIAQGVSPIIVSSLIQAAGTPAADPSGAKPPGAAPNVKEPDADEEPDTGASEKPSGGESPTDGD